MGSFVDDFERRLRAASQELANRVVQFLDTFQREYAGRDVSVVRPALEAGWAGINDGARITDPELSITAQAVSERRRVWLDERGHIMIEEPGDQ